MVSGRVRDQTGGARLGTVKLRGMSPWHDCPYVCWGIRARQACLRTIRNALVGTGLVDGVWSDGPAIHNAVIIKYGSM